MKKLLLLGAAMAVATLSSYGQGSVNFANTGTTRVFYNAPGGGTTWIPVGGQFLAELVYAPDGTAAGEFDSLAIRTGATSTFGGSAGLLPGVFQGGNRTITSISPAGGFGLFQVRVWEAAAGASWQDAMAAGNPQFQAGRSGVLRVDTGDTTTVPPGTPGSLTTAGFVSFTVQPIPEPSAIALGLLGAGALLMLRRRK